MLHQSQTEEGDRGAEGEKMTNINTWGVGEGVPEATKNNTEGGGGLQAR